jgi:hypothetical protein
MGKRLVPVLVSLLMFGITLSALGQERALLVELTFNPVGPEYEDGRLNPFSVKAIREAMNLLLDREFIAREIYTRYKETARPWLFPVSPAFLGTLGLTDLAAELAQKYAYNFEKGKAVIHEEMTKLGAVLRDNVWYYKNAPVKVKVIAAQRMSESLLRSISLSSCKNLALRWNTKLYRQGKQPQW